MGILTILTLLVGTCLKVHLVRLEALIQRDWLTLLAIDRYLDIPIRRSLHIIREF